MKKITLRLINGQDLAGYEVGYFIVYKDYYYWYIAHKSGYKIPGNFARRRDAVQVCNTMGGLANWNFDEPANADVDSCRAAHASACTKDWKTGIFVPNTPAPPPSLEEIEQMDRSLELGLLWWDDTDCDLAIKVCQAAESFAQKHGGRRPDLCFVNLADVGRPFPFDVAGIEVRGKRTIARDHLWIGVGSREYEQDQEEI